MSFGVPLTVTDLLKSKVTVTVFPSPTWLDADDVKTSVITGVTVSILSPAKVWVAPLTFAACPAESMMVALPTLRPVTARAGTLVSPAPTL